MKVSLIPADEPEKGVPTLFVTSNDYDTHLEFYEQGGMRLARLAFKGLLTEHEDENLERAYNCLCTGHFELVLEDYDTRRAALCTPKQYTTRLDLSNFPKDKAVGDWLRRSRSTTWGQYLFEPQLPRRVAHDCATRFLVAKRLHVV